MNEKQINTASKYLSLLLRHQPEKIGLQLDENGWASVEELLLKWDGPVILDYTSLEHIVSTNNKKRFSFDESGQKIRASQGHSIGIDLQLEPQSPPDVLYHGTVEKYLASIRSQGLLKMDRQHVHLSMDEGTATAVAQRRGKPVLLQIRSGDMQASGYSFFLSANSVWLTEHVPVDYIQFPS